MKIKYLSYARRAAAGIGIAGLGTAGAVMLMAAGTGTALAGTPGTCVASTVATDTNCQTTASVTVGSSTTIADNTPSVTFTAPVSLPGAATNNPQPVSLTAATNDTAGLSVDATPSGDMTSSGSAIIPIDCLGVYGNQTGPSVGSGQPTQFGGSGAPGCAAAPSVTGEVATTPVLVDTFTGVQDMTYVDHLALTVPNVPAGTYSATVTFSVSGN